MIHLPMSMTSGKHKNNRLNVNNIPYDIMYQAKVNE